MARFWVGGTGNWDAADTTHWSASSGGAGGETVPTASDSVTLNGSSGGGTVTVTAAAFASTIGMGSYTGTLNTNGQTVSIDGDFNLTGTGTRVLTLGSSMIILGLGGTGGSWVATTTTNLTFNPNTSTIKMTGDFPSQFAGGSLTYNNLWSTIGGGGANTMTIVGSNTFNDFKSENPKIMRFTVGTTQTVTTFTVSGTAGNLIVLDSTTTGTYALVKTGGGTISRDYLDIQHSVATPVNTWYAGNNSTNNQATATAGSGWIFRPPNNNFLPFF